MADVAGTVKSLSGGIFYVKDENGNQRVLKVGDTIYENDAVYGDNKNGSSSQVEIELSGNDIIVLNDGQEQLIDPSLVEIAFGTEELFFTKSGIDLKADEHKSSADIVSDLRDAEFNDEKIDAIDEEVTSHLETSTGKEEEEDKVEGDTQFQGRDGNATDVNSDLRDASFKARTQIFEDRDLFETESEDRLSFDSNELNNSNSFNTFTPNTPSIPTRPSSIPTPHTPETPIEPSPQIPSPKLIVTPPVTPTPTPDPILIKIVAADENGNPLKDSNGNYIDVNETPEGGETYYVALAFEPNTTIFNDTSKLDIQEGTVDFIFTDGIAKGDDYDPQNDLTGIDLGTPVKADALDDYISDNGEKFTVIIENYTPASPSTYTSVTINPDTVTTTITDNPSDINKSTDESNTEDDHDTPSYDQADTVYLQLSTNDEVDEAADATLTHTFTLVDKDGNSVNLPTGETINVTLNYIAIGGVDGVESEDFTTQHTTFTIIGDGGNSYNFSNIVADDYLEEGTEGYTVSISSIDTTSGAFENIAIDTTNNSAEGRITDNTTTDTEVKIVLVAVDNPSSVTDYSDLPVDGNGVLIIDNDNITSEGGYLYYIPIAVDEDGKPLDTQDGTVTVSYGTTSDTDDDDATANTDYVNTKTSTNIGEIFSVKTNVDATGEVDEKYEVTISNPVGTSYETPIVDTTNNKVTSTIEDSVYVKIITNGSVIEGNDLTHTIQLVDKNGNLIDVNIPSTGTGNLTVTLEYSADETVDGDYSSSHTPNSTFTIDFTGTTNSITITNETLDDFVADNDEDYTLTITGFTQDSSNPYQIIGIDDENSVTGEILDGVTLGNPIDANVDEDDFDIESGVTSITDTQLLNIVAPNGDNDYTLSFDGTPIFTSDDATFNTADSDNLTSDGTVIEYVVTGDTTTAYAGTGRTDADRVFVITLDKNSAGGTDDSYTYTQYKNIDHPISGNSDATDDDDVVLTFGYKITDQGQTSSVENFTVTVSDSLPSGTAQNIEVNEDSSDTLIYISDESFASGNITLNDGVNGDQLIADGGTINIYDSAKNDVVGTLTNNGDGTVKFTPTANYSGDTAGFTYGISDGDGDTSGSTVGITVNPVADTPTLADKTVTTWEDANTTDAAYTDGNAREGLNVKSLDLDIPVKDQTDKNDITGGSETGDSPERLGAIEFSFATSDDFGTATIGYDSDNDGVLDSELQDITKDSTFTIDITDVADYHVNGTSGDYHLTQAQYESIAIMHDEDNATNIKTKITVASHEVDESGDIFSPDIVSTNAEQIVTLDIKAVTDDISELLFTDGTDTYTYDIPSGTKEGEVNIDIATLLKNQILGDNDGSENRWYEISGGLPEGTIVKIGTSQGTVDENGDVKVNFPDDTEANPTFTIEFPEYYSSVSGTPLDFDVTITLKVQDTDNDSTVTPEIKTDSVTLNIKGDIEAVAGEATLQISQAFGDEDAGRTGGNTDAQNGTIDDEANGIELEIKVTSDDTDGSEKFIVRIDDIPDDGSLYVFDQSLDSGSGEWVLVDKDFVSSGNLSIAEGTSSDTWQIVIKDFQNDELPKFIPAHNSDDDYTFKVNAQTVDDVSTWNGTWTAITDKDMDVVVKDVADVPINTELNGFDINGDANNTTGVYNLVLDEQTDLDGDTNKFDLQDVYQLPANLDSYDNADNSETLSIEISHLPAGFGVEGASLIGSGVWTFKADDIANVKITTPANFSGEATFNLKYITTENEGDSKTHDTDPVTIFVSPNAEAEINTSTTGNEDILQKVDFGISYQNGDTNETLEEVRIKVSEVEGKEFTLYIGNSTATAISTLTPVDGYYVLTAAQADTIYAQNTTDHTHGIYNFEVGYTVKDTETDNNTFNTKDETISYTLTIDAVTDTPSIALGVIDDSDGAVTATGTNVSVSATGTTFTVPVTTTSNDQDGSENITQIIISGVPQGVTISGATYNGYVGSTANGIWVIDGTNLSDTVLNGDGGLQDITFTVNAGANFDDRDITITTYTKDDNSEAEELSVSTTFNLQRTYADGTGPGNPPEFVLGEKSATIYEDDKNDTDTYNLGESLTVTNIGSYPSGGYAVTITDFAEGTVVTGYDYSYVETVGGNEVTRYVITGTGSASDIESKLSSVIVTPPANVNDTSSSTESMTFTATIATYDGGTFNAGNTISYEESILPVTDDMTIAISATDINEDEPSDFTITLSNDVDTITSIIDGKLYIKVNENYESGETNTSTFVYGGNTLSTTSNPDGLTGDYYVIDISSYTMGTALNFTYNPGENRHGEVTFDVVVKNKEGHSWDTGVYDTDVQTSTNTATITVNPVIDGFSSAGVSNASGDEAADGSDNRIKIDMNATLADPSESIGSASLDGIPNGFLIYYGSDVNSLSLATNTGASGGTFIVNPDGDNVSVDLNKWLIPLDDGNLPSEVWIQAPDNWSGTISDISLDLYGITDGASSNDVSYPFDVTFNSVADAITIDPTMTFGDAFDWVDLKLNANMEDVDGSETMSLQITGLDDMAQFQLNDGTAISAAFSAGNDTDDDTDNVWTIEGITYDEINNIQFTQDTSASGVSVEAWTVESTNNDLSSHTTAETFDLTLNEVSEIITLGEGVNLDFDKLDSLSSIDEIDLSITGVNDISNLSLQDVLDITDGDNELKITGDSDDSISLNTTGWSGGTVTDNGDNTTYEYTDGSANTVKITVDDNINTTGL